MSGHEKEIKMTQNKGNQMVQFLAGIGGEFYETYFPRNILEKKN